MGAYAKLYRRSFLCAHGIRFPPTMYIEDRHFLLQCLVAGARLAPLEAQVYHRHLRPDSTMRRVTLKHAMDATGIYQLDVALLERAGLLAACGLQAAWATLMVDLYLARAIPADDTTVHDTLRGELTRQEELFRRLPIPAPGRAVLGHAAGRLRRELAQGSRGFLATRIWLRLVRLLAT
jgi:hypothetical protein